MVRQVALTRLMSPKRRSRFARVCPRHAARLELAGAHLEMKLELGVDLVFDTGAPESRTKPAAERHAPLGIRIFETAAEKRAHCSVSATS
jgi:hypothetical protein